MRTLDNADRAVMEDVITQTLTEFSGLSIQDAAIAANEALSRLMIAFPEVFEGTADDDCEPLDSEDQYQEFDYGDDSGDSDLEFP